MADIRERVEMDPMSEDEFGKWLEEQRAEGGRWQAEYDAARAASEAAAEAYEAKREELRKRTYRVAFLDFGYTFGVALVALWAATVISNPMGLVMAVTLAIVWAWAFASAFHGKWG